MARHPVCACARSPHGARATELRLRADGYETASTVPLQGLPSRRIALRMVSSLRATAMMATFLGLPAAMRRSKKALSTGLCRRPTIAPMNRTLRTLVLPPPMKLLPRHWPDWRVKGARPTSATICFPPRVPSSGSSAISVREIVGPTLGTEESRSSFSRQAGEPRTASSISVSTLESSRSSAFTSLAILDPGISPFLTLPLGADHLDDLTPAGDEIGKLLGSLVAQRPWCDAGRFAEVGDHAGIDRVGLGPLTDGLGESANLRRIGDRHRQTSCCQCRHHDGLETSGGLEHDEVGLQYLEAADEIVQSGTIARDDETLTTRTHGNIEAVFRNVDTAYGLVHGDPSLSNRARRAAPATVRVRWNGRRSTRLSNGLTGPEVYRTPAYHRASLGRRVG